MATLGLLSRSKTTVEKLIPLINHNWLLELAINNIGLTLVSIISIIPAIYIGFPNWLKSVYIWASITIIIFSLLRISIIFLSKKYFIVKEKQKSNVSIIFILQRLIAISVTLFIMVSSGIIGARCFGQNLVAQSCLTCQITKGNYNTAIWLVLLGADLNKVDEFGQSPLLHAVSKRQNKLAKLLVFSGAEIEIKDKPTLTSPLIVAVYQGSFELTKFLLEHNADPNKFVISASPLRAALKNKRFDIANLLLEHGADPNLKDFLGMTPVFYESRLGNISSIDFLINNKAEINITNNKNETPLYSAVLSGRKEVIAHLLAKGAKIDEKSIAKANELKHTEIEAFLKQVAAKTK